MEIKELENRIINADCMDILKQLPDKCIDLVCTDCPYHVGHNGGGGRCQKKWMTAGQMENYENTKSGKMFDFNDISFEDWLPEIYRVLKDNTHCYIMINGLNFAELQKQAERVGFIYQNILVWEKNNATPNKFYMQKLEFILMLRKGKERWINNMGQKNLIKVPNNVGNKVHPTEKPVSLMEVLIENSTNKGGLVLDPFAGSCPVAVACKKLDRKFICVEIDRKYYEAGIKRFECEQRQGTLF